jgi:hypothetical protein
MHLTPFPAWLNAAICWIFLGLNNFAALAPDLTFTVTEWAGVSRTNEIICSGVPLPRQAGVRSVSQLRVETAEGQPVPACFQVLARWHSGRLDTNAPVQWVLVEMPATVAAYEARRYQLAISPDPVAGPEPAVKLELTQAGNQVTVNTGAARFTLGKNASQLFDEVRLAEGTVAATGGALTALANSNRTTHAAVRRIVVERVSPLAAVVVIDGLYDLPAVGDGRLAASRRYEFFAGSSAVLVRHEVAWEGSLFGVGVLASEGVPNGLRIQQLRDTLEIPWIGPRQAWVWGGRTAPPVQAAGLTDETGWVEQCLRLQRTDPLRFEIGLGSQRQSGRAADGGALAMSDGTKTVALALNHMHCFEPQALRCLPNGALAVEIASDQAWLGARQGLYAQFGLWFTTNQPAPGAVQAELWARLNHPLRAWPEAAWFAASRAVDEFPVGDLAPSWREYDTLVPTVLSRTTNLVFQLGLSGLQTYGLFPRYWGNPMTGFDELTNSVPENDPTPAESWDDVYWGATWTDYHDTSTLAAFWAMRSGQSAWLDEITHPAALRMLHTQIIHGAPEDDYFYIGQSPTGYGGYRADFNSSHAYFDNLLLYYWFTGDYTVVETLARGAASMRQYFYPGRPGVAVEPRQPPPDPWARPVGRVASQWITAFRFVGLAGQDASFLDDYRGNLARAVSQYYAELEKDGRRYGFWSDQPLATPGTNHTDQIWLLTLYDMNNLYRCLVDTGDAPLGDPARRPSEVLAAWVNTLAFLAPNAAPEANGTVQGQWPNAILFAWAGDRIGGQLLWSTNYETPAADPYLWDTGKAALCATVSREADRRQDPGLRQLAADLAALTLRSAWNQGTPPPLGKEQGLYLSRLHPAISRLNLPEPLRLAASREGRQLRLSWPAGLVDGELEQAPTVDGGSWQPVFHLWGATNATFEVFPGSSFFRLRRNP